MSCSNAVPLDSPIAARRSRVLAALAVVSCLVFSSFLAPPAAAAGAYTFTKVLDSADGYDPFGFECTAINSRGDIAIRTQRVDPEDEFNTVDVIVRADADGGVTTIVDADEQDFNFIGRRPAINDRGDVSFAATLRARAPRGEGNEVIARGRGGPLTIIARTQPTPTQPDAPFNFFGFDTSINNKGEVAFRGELDNFDLGLFSGRGDPVTTHYLASTSEFNGSFALASINDGGQIAFQESTGDASGVFRGANGSFVTVAAAADHGFSEASINASGVVAFYDSFFDDETFTFVQSVVTGSGGPLATVADTTGPFASFGFRPPSINNDGAVAFFAELDGTSFPPEGGIFLGPDPVADRVVGTGDTLDGRTASEVLFCEGGLNNAGQLAFTAFFEDPDTFELSAAVFRATPASP